MVIPALNYIWKRWAKAVIGFLILVYLVNFFTPFRLTNDTIRYFLIMENYLGILPESIGFTSDFLPLGYVGFLVVLKFSGLLNPFFIAFFQLGFFLGSLYFLKKIFPEFKQGYLLLLLLLLNWTTLKYVLTPLSECQFLFFSMGTLYFTTAFEKNNSIPNFCWLVLFCSLAILTRTIGVILIPSIILAFILKRRNFSPGNNSSRMKILLLSIMIILGGSLFILKDNLWTYAQFLIAPLVIDPWYFISHNLGNHLMDWAELFINIPLSKMKLVFPSGIPKIGYLLTGIVMLGLLLRVLYKRRKVIPLVASIYLMLYGLAIFNWPFWDARFWFPVFPLVALLLLNFMGKYSKFKGFLIPYFLTGLFVLGYYTHLSWDKSAMAEKHDAGIWKKEYHYLFFEKETSDSSLNRKAYHILEQYN